MSSAQGKGGEVSEGVVFGLVTHPAAAELSMHIS